MANMTTTATTAATYLPYHEPALPDLLITTTFLLALNVAGAALDRALACGLVGQVLVGVAWGAPGTRWLAAGFQGAVAALGYAGLVLVVYAGGVETSVAALRADAALSAAVALTGVAVPIGLSFALLAPPGGPFLGTIDGDGASAASSRLLPAFAAGAALCSTSLGTTFSVLRASGFGRTRLGAVLASAALLDDVVGLVMVRIITSLGQMGENTDVEPATILRPVLVSVAFAVAVPLACRYVLGPGQEALDRIVQRYDGKEGEKKGGKTSKRAKMAVWIHSQEAAFIAQTALLVFLAVAANYAGASVLLAAYLAGAVVSWWDGRRDPAGEPSPSRDTETRPAEPASSTEVPQDAGRREPEPVPAGGDPSSRITAPEVTAKEHTATKAFDTYYAQTLHRVLKPFFFASIGFSIPISQLFVGGIVWRGIIYTILMIIGKLVCGLWLVRFPISVSGASRSGISSVISKYNQAVSKIRSWGFRTATKPRTTHGQQSGESPSTQATRTETSRLPASPTPRLTASTSISVPSSPNSDPATPPKPLSLYPAAVMGCAMVSRGEIGFLISSMAESQGVFRRPDEDASSASDLFLVVTWAIFLCTILGPVCTGLLVKRIRKLERASETSRGARDVLGVWGVA